MLLYEDALNELHVQVPRAMGRYSPAYHSPPRRGYGDMGRRPPSRGYSGGGRGGRGDQGSVSLLVRNIPLRCRYRNRHPAFPPIVYLLSHRIGSLLCTYLFLTNLQA
jgi:hypothetical protein